VAVKRFIKQKLTERRVLEFRAEMAFLSELHHPNVVVFIGACVRTPNLCVVTEFVKQGALRDILYRAQPVAASGAARDSHGRNGGGGMAKLEWKQRLRILRSAAIGVNYLHTLKPVAIIHRDLKSSNLLVDENWNVKVADFGFARLKEENATMTRCGTPCWTGIPTPLFGFLSPVYAYCCGVACSAGGDSWGEVLGKGRRVLVRRDHVGGGGEEAALRRTQLHGRVAGCARGQAARRARRLPGRVPQADDALLARQGRQAALDAGCGGLPRQAHRRRW
jgi:tRNA A-37 threonylcarbamoyl transferase component Bud32